MATSSTDFTGPSRIGIFWGKVHHWTFNRKGRLSLHTGEADKCRRVHYNQRGDKK